MSGSGARRAAEPSGAGQQPRRARLSPRVLGRESEDGRRKRDVKQQKVRQRLISIPYRRCEKTGHGDSSDLPPLCVDTMINY